MHHSRYYSQIGKEDRQKERPSQMTNANQRIKHVIQNAKGMFYTGRSGYGEIWGTLEEAFTYATHQRPNRIITEGLCFEGCKVVQCVGRFADRRTILKNS
jgi:hypothetical protein